MDKKMRKATQRLQEAQEYAKNYKLSDTALLSIKAAHVRRPNTFAPIEVVKKPSPRATPLSPSTTEKFTSFQIVKIAKGDFRVQADSRILDKRFKSITKAQEWCSAHSR